MHAPIPPIWIKHNQFWMHSNFCQCVAVAVAIGTPTPTVILAAKCNANDAYMQIKNALNSARLQDEMDVDVNVGAQLHQSYTTVFKNIARV